MIHPITSLRGKAQQVSFMEWLETQREPLTPQRILEEAPEPTELGDDELFEKVLEAAYEDQCGGLPFVGQEEKVECLTWKN